MKCPKCGSKTGKDYKAMVGVIDHCPKCGNVMLSGFSVDDGHHFNWCENCGHESKLERECCGQPMLSLTADNRRFKCMMCGHEEKVK